MSGSRALQSCLLIVAILAAPILALGCGSAVSSGHNTALDSFDLQQMTDQMAMSIAASPEVQAAIQKDGKLRVVVQPVVNEMTAEVLPSGQADAFTARVRYLLSKHAPDRFLWIMNRDAFYKLRGKELDYDLGPSPDAINPDYALVARFRSLTDETSEHRRSSYLCVYELTDLVNRKILWSDKYEVQKKAVKQFLD